MDTGNEPSLDDLREWNTSIIDSVDRAAHVVSRMRAFARRGESDYSTCFLNEIIRESVQLITFEARRRGASRWRR